MLFDTHTHLDDPRFDEDRETLIDRLKTEGFSPVMAVAADKEGCENVVALAEQYDFIYAAVGFHPDAAQRMSEQDLSRIEALAASPRVKAIGEIGLDYHWPEDTDKPAQQLWFARQMELAEKSGLPVIIHSRDATADTLSILRDFPKVRGVLHCFSGSVETMREVLTLGYSIALGGVVTFKNARVAREVAAAVPLDRLLIETDCPYLAPEPYRGKRNDPSMVRLVAEKIADIRGIPTDEIAHITRENGLKLFNI